MANIIKFKDTLKDDEFWAYICPECGCMSFSIICEGPELGDDFLGIRCEDCDFEIIFGDIELEDD